MPIAHGSYCPYPCTSIDHVPHWLCVPYPCTLYPLYPIAHVTHCPMAFRVMSHIANGTIFYYFCTGLTCLTFSSEVTGMYGCVNLCIILWWFIQNCWNMVSFILQFHYDLHWPFHLQLISNIRKEINENYFITLAMWAAGTSFLICCLSWWTLNAICGSVNVTVASSGANHTCSVKS